MNKKQKKTLLGAIVTLILVATIVAVALAVHWSSTTKIPNGGDPDPKEQLKKVVDAIKKAVEGQTHGHFYFSLRMGLQDEGEKVVHGLESPRVHKVALKEVEVRASKNAVEEGEGIPEKMSGMDEIAKTVIEKPVYVLCDRGVFEQFQVEGVEWKKYGGRDGDSYVWRKKEDDSVHYFEGALKK